MASPATYDEAPKDDSSKKILFRFCPGCSNLLFPREDKVNNVLLFCCRNCTVAEPAPTPCVMRHEISSSVGDTAGITQDVAQDPTLPRIQKPCPACGENEAVFFQSQQRTAETGMKLYYVCTSCGNVWQ